MPEQDVVVPSVAESVAEVTLLSWHKQVGDFVETDDPLCEVETDKANTDLPSTLSGVLTAIVAKEGDTVSVGDVIARIDTDKTEADAGGDAAETGQTTQTSTQTTAKRSETTAKAPPPEPKTRDDDIQAGVPADQLADLSPAVRRLVSEQGIDPDTIQATGSGGRLTKEDVETFLQNQTGDGPTTFQEPDAAQARPQPKPSAPPSGPPSPPKTATAAPAGGAPGGQTTRRVPMSKMRKRIAENLVAAQQNAAILTTFNEVDLTEVMALRKKYKDSFGEKHGVGLGFMSFFAKAACVALKEFERVNARIDGDEIVYHDYVNLGVAVSTERGLTVPVLKNVQDLSFAEIEKEIKRVALAAREGKLGFAEMSGGTFTVTNGGVFGSLLSTPILNAPQSGILGMHTIQERPMAVNGEVKIRRMMYVALSYDHRIVDGKESVSFLVRLKQLLEDPARLLLDV